MVIVPERILGADGQRDLPVRFVWLTAPIGEDPHKRDYIVSNQKLERTGWLPDHSLDMGIAELIKGYRTIRNGRYSND